MCRRDLWISETADTGSAVMGRYLYLLLLSAPFRVCISNIDFDLFSLNSIMVIYTQNSLNVQSEK